MLFSGDSCLISGSSGSGSGSLKSPGCRPSPKVKKMIYDASEHEDFDREEIPTYEEVARLYPRPGLPRPLVLIGPPGVGRNELRRRLLDLDVDKFKSPVPSEFIFDLSYQRANLGKI